MIVIVINIIIVILIITYIYDDRLSERKRGRPTFIYNTYVPICDSCFFPYTPLQTQGISAPPSFSRPRWTPRQRPRRKAERVPWPLLPRGQGWRERERASHSPCPCWRIQGKNLWWCCILRARGALGKARCQGLRLSRQRRPGRCPSPRPRSRRRRVRRACVGKGRGGQNSYMKNSFRWIDKLP